MKNKIDLAFVNWLIHLADPTVSLPALGSHNSNEKEILELFLRKLINGELSSLVESNQVISRMTSLLSQLDSLDDKFLIAEVYPNIRQFFSTKQWLAIVIPSGIESISDNVLYEPRLLEYLVDSASNQKGLVLQLDHAPGEVSTLFDVHQVLGTVLNESINWPGILLWMPGGDSVFLPVSSVDFLEIDIEARVQWVFSKLFSSSFGNLARLKFEYKVAFPEVFEHENKTVHILQLSDLNIGSKVANYRVYGVQKFVRQLVEELGEASKIIPVVTGNIMDNPSEKHIDQVSSFWSFLSGMGAEAPVLVFGNKDVRKDGNINESYRNAIGFQYTKVTWFEYEKVALISVNTVVHGDFEHGSIGEEQVEAIEYEIERKKNSSEYKFILLLHHAPPSHQEENRIPSVFYDKILGDSFTSIEAFEGVDLLFDFVKKNAVSALLHGHMQMPTLSLGELKLPIVGCGSSIGNRSKYDDSVYFSINIVSINKVLQKTTARFLAIRKPESGLTEPKRHEVLFQKLS